MWKGINTSITKFSDVDMRCNFISHTFYIYRKTLLSLRGGGGEGRGCGGYLISETREGLNREWDLTFLLPDHPLCYFTLSNTRRSCSSMESLWVGKG